MDAHQILSERKRVRCWSCGKRRTCWRVAVKHPSVEVAVYVCDDCVFELKGQTLYVGAS